ncbi:MAG: hypothetical protein IIC99_10670 [Chloroflexi bacterium]|nr:hypothetical protein [Chloroflexota bacterium]
MVKRRFDGRLLGPGWAGEISDDEVFFIQKELLRDRKLAYQWGFAPSRRTRPADAIRRVALEGDPEHRNSNVSLTRPNSRNETRPDTESISQPEILPETPTEVQPEIQADAQATVLTLWAYAGIDVPQPPSESDLTKVGG